MALLTWLAAPLGVGAFPSWMGVYGSYRRHDGANPGVFQVLMNEDRSSLRAEVGLRVGGGVWDVRPMTYAGRVDGNSRWTYAPAEPFPAGATVEYFFHGFDGTGAHLWDSQNGANYRWTVPAPPALEWVGAATTWPVQGQIDPIDDVWVDFQTWPAVSVATCRVVVTTNRWASSRAVDGVRRGVVGNNGAWHANLGQFLGSASVEFYVEARGDRGQTIYANVGGANHRFTVNPGRAVEWVGDTHHWPTNGAITSLSDLWLNTETWPTGAAMRVHVLTSVEGGSWALGDMQLSGKDGNNDWWNLNAGRLAPGHRLHYLIEARDGLGRARRDPLTGTPRVAAAAGSPVDTDADRLPDDWERHWFASLDAAGAGNPDGDGLEGLPFDNLLEEALGTDPLRSNDASRIALVWTPSIPVRGGALRLSYRPATHGIVGAGAVFALVGANGWRDAAETVAMATNSWRGRVETTRLVPDAAGSVDVVFRNDAGVWDNNMGLDWHIATRARAPGETPDADGDTLPDAWELPRSLDPFDGTGAHGASGDPDADGFSNADELLAGTDPTSASNRPIRLAGRVTSVATSSAPIRLLAWPLPTNAASVQSATISGTTFSFRALSPGVAWQIHGCHDLDRDGLRGDAEPQAVLPGPATGYTGSSTSLVVVLVVDTDEDGLPDVWEQRIADASGGDRLRDIHDVDPWDDADRDGVNNAEEYALRLDPLSAASRPSSIVQVSTNASAGHHATLQAGIDAVAPGGWVLVHPGTYRGPGNASLSIRGKDVIVRALDGAARTVVDGEGAGPLATIEGAATNRILLDGFTWRGGSSSEGGGVSVHGGSVEFRRSSFERCRASERGGALSVRGGSVTVRDSSFSTNQALVAGGAVAAESGASLALAGCSFLANRAVMVEAVGGAIAARGATVVVERCWFRANRSEGSASVAHAEQGRLAVRHITATANSSREGCALEAGTGVMSVANSIVWSNAPASLPSSGATLSNIFLTAAGVDAVSGLLLTNSAAIDTAATSTGLLRRVVWDDPRKTNGLGIADAGWVEFVDVDLDGLADAWERRTVPGLSLEPAGDLDADGLSNEGEARFRANPEAADTDGDGLKDGWEALNGLNPTDRGDAMEDHDRDGIPTLYEFHRGTDPGMANPLPPPLPVPVGMAPATIQSLVDQAPDMSVIVLPSGMYSGTGNVNVTVSGKNLLLLSAEGAGACVIDCEGRGRGFTFGPGCDQRTMLRGVTIKNGNVSSGMGEGGAIRIVNASPTISDCVIVSNTSEIGGGGVAMENSFGVVRRTLIQGNVARYNYGGGLFVRGGAPTVVQSHVLNNACRGASPSRGGGGAYLAGSRASIRSSIVAGNSTDGLGGGLLVHGTVPPEILHCTLTANTNQGLVVSGVAYVENSVIHGNAGADFLHLTYGEPPVYSVVGGMADASIGLLDVDPLLTPKSLRPSSSSPVIDRGSFAGIGLVDVDGEPRHDAAHAPNEPSIVDIGADEFVDADGDQLPDLWERSHFQHTGYNDADIDNDGLLNRAEYDHDLDPQRADTDQDGLRDGDEVLVHMSDPHVRDTDGDGLLDGDEATASGAWDTDGLQTFVTDEDTDDDGYRDGEEALHGMNASVSTDGDVRLRMTRLVIMSHWNALIGEPVVFRHAPGSRGDLKQLADMAQRVRAKMVREVSP